MIVIYSCRRIPEPARARAANDRLIISLGPALGVTAATSIFGGDYGFSQKNWIFARNILSN